MLLLQLSEAAAEAAAELSCCCAGAGRWEVSVLLLLLLLPLQGVLPVHRGDCTIAERVSSVLSVMAELMCCAAMGRPAQVGDPVQGCGRPGYGLCSRGDLWASRQHRGDR